MRIDLRPLLVSVLLSFGSLVGCATSDEPEAPYRHIVLIELADPQDLAALRVDVDRAFRTIPTIEDWEMGVPLELGRPEVDGRWHLALVMDFESVDDYTAYTVDPAHVDLVTRWKPRLASLRIFDANTGSLPR